MRAPVSARVTGFDYTTHHAYTTEVAVDGRSWTLALRYNTFFRFYSKLLEVEPQFKAPFPPKGGLFFSPQPEERQVQLDDFLQNSLTFYDLRGRPEPMGALLDDLLQISEHLASPDKDEDEQEPEASQDEKTEVSKAKAKETETEKQKKEEESTTATTTTGVGGLLNAKWAKALVSAAMQAVVVNTFQEAAEAGKASKAAAATSEDAKPAKSLESMDADTPSTPTSRASLTKTPRQSATIAPLESKPEPKMAKAPSASKLWIDTDAQVQADKAPLVVANVTTGGVRDRIAVWERRSSSPSPKMATPRTAGRRSSSCSSAGDQAPIVPLGVSDVSKPVVSDSKPVVEPVKVEETVEEVQRSEEETVEEVKPSEEVEAVEAVQQSEEEKAVEEVKQTEEEAVDEVKQTEEVETVTESVAAESEAAAPAAEEPAFEAAEAAEAAEESDGYDSDASDDIRRLGLEKVDVNERLRPYRHPVFFQGFRCRVPMSSMAGRA